MHAQENDDVTDKEDSSTCTSEADNAGSSDEDRQPDPVLKKSIHKLKYQVKYQQRVLSYFEARISKLENSVRALESFVETRDRLLPPSQPTALPSAVASGFSGYFTNIPTRVQPYYYPQPVKPPGYLPQPAAASSSSSPMQATTPVVRKAKAHTQAPKCMQIYSKGKCLPSEEIQKSALVPPEVTISRYANLCEINKVSQLAVKLARESYFGNDVLSRCTVAGQGPLPALPQHELGCLKQRLFELYPVFWDSPVDFEEIWKECATAIGQAAKRLRQLKLM